MFLHLLTRDYNFVIFKQSLKSKVLNLLTRGLLLFFSWLVLDASAQDIHFSMFYASPLTLNPAMTGTTEGTYRAAVIYRNQWRSITSPAPFSTFAASFEMKLLQDKLPNNVFAVGGLLVSDQTNDAVLTSTSFMLSAAYHKGLDKNHKHFLGVGLQAAYTNMGLKWNELTFPSQIDLSNYTFNTTQQSGENVQKTSLNYFDLHAGILQQSQITDFMGMMTGFAVFHLVEPKESFLGENVRIADRFVVSEGLRFKVTDKVYITPNFIYQYQLKAQEINFGTAVEYHMQVPKSELIASIGGWYRVNDAPIISAGLEYFKARLMFSYDINTSGLKAATTDRGAFELALIFTGFLKTKQVNYPVLVPCPMM